MDTDHERAHIIVRNADTGSNISIYMDTRSVRAVTARAVRRRGTCRPSVRTNRVVSVAPDRSVADGGPVTGSVVGRFAVRVVRAVLAVEVRRAGDAGGPGSGAEPGYLVDERLIPSDLLFRVVGVLEPPVEVRVVDDRQRVLVGRGRAPGPAEPERADGQSACRRREQSSSPFVDSPRRPLVVRHTE